MYQNLAIGFQSFVEEIQIGREWETDWEGFLPELVIMAK